MTHREKTELWERYPEVWEMFVEFNDITQEDGDAWKRLADRAGQINDAYGLPVVEQLLIETVGQLEKISRKRGGYR